MPGRSSSHCPDATAGPENDFLPDAFPIEPGFDNVGNPVWSGVIDGSNVGATRDSILDGQENDVTRQSGFWQPADFPRYGSSVWYKLIWPDLDGMGSAVVFDYQITATFPFMGQLYVFNLNAATFDPLTQWMPYPASVEELANFRDLGDQFGSASPNWPDGFWTYQGYGPFTVGPPFVGGGSGSFGSPPQSIGLLEVLGCATRTDPSFPLDGEQGTFVVTWSLHL